VRARSPEFDVWGIRRRSSAVSLLPRRRPRRRSYVCVRGYALVWGFGSWGVSRRGTRLPPTHSAKPSCAHGVPPGMRTYLQFFWAMREVAGRVGDWRAPARSVAGTHST
jgi:hypothetical protein